MTALRGVAVAVLVLLALVVQIAVLSAVSIYGVVPNLVLVVVVAAALARGPEFGTVTGLLAGLLLDLAPPADHLAGRWALAFLLVGFLAGKVRHDVGSVPVRTAIIGACSFVATSIFAITGLVLHDLTVGPVQLASVIAISVLLDVIAGLVLLPLLLGLFERLRPARVALR